MTHKADAITKPLYQPNCIYNLNLTKLNIQYSNNRVKDEEFEKIWPRLKRF